MKFYGSTECSRCRAAIEELKEAGAEYEFIDVIGSKDNLKEFLQLRDSSSLFDVARQEDRIGIPAFIKDDGELTLSVADVK
ncbi:MAG: glutaredoxin [Corynebacterium casei]|uniref:glutaredoxin n=1 Tax=Corynebacterium casei TaxID=160386 RepID=UPI000EB9FC8D|nr:glutaredoxin [Corynebacterium casei]MDN5885373.1 glutaredoxin [Corynebacterium casei]MDN6628183.1 glutaredoxin [Corynebacterium casei]MDN6673580.1 glutaredoxin [Corynebacterium casei]MDN6694216.1 glutaredoxin [Corynebacterium casei]HCJ68713.1 glutaredoxin [Corynebacterium casei]